MLRKRSKGTGFSSCACGMSLREAQVPATGGTPANSRLQSVDTPPQTKAKKRASVKLLNTLAAHVRAKKTKIKAKKRGSVELIDTLTAHVRGKQARLITSLDRCT